MLRKLIVLGISAALAKRAWDQYQAESGTRAVAEPLATPQPEPDLPGATPVSPGVAPESPLAWH